MRAVFVRHAAHNAWYQGMGKDLIEELPEVPAKIDGNGLDILVTSAMSVTVTAQTSRISSGTFNSA